MRKTTLICVRSFFFSALIIIFNICETAVAQVRSNILYGQLLLNNETFRPSLEKYRRDIDRLDKALSADHNDTIALFERALLLDKFNNIQAFPKQDEPKALQGLRTAERYANRADSLGMKDIKLKVLRAQIYKDLAYRFLGDERWKYNGKAGVGRKNSFELYKKKANELYEKLAELDVANAYDYKKLKETGEYPIKE
ncbi:hypothetical protein [Mucilaginibacter sp. SJ]|uniref:hypothetical protein n=1 Tax=Mucilaginibacter sp. SJ TaxID=3029053 RepID=UPI0023A9F116|nr:hypothetical protein [Mucilaginibacter sp. SJ]WEA01755.1 hypothetical protein MusilaSJ_02315 [Mucilaginibacter sp. SJ]